MMADDKKPFHINWPKGATLTMDEKSLQEMRLGLEVQFKHMIYSQPGFEFYHSIGNTNFFQRFRTDDGIDFGTLHVYWDKNAENNIVLVDPETGERTNRDKGDWRHRWFKPGERPEPIPPREDSIISEEGMKKIYIAHAQKLADVAVNQNKRMMEERLRRQKIKQFEEDDNEEDMPILLN